MKRPRKKLTIVVPKPKARGVLPPPPVAHKDRRNDYNRAQTNNPKNW